LRVEIAKKFNVREKRQKPKHVAVK
jgi:hypothetical protein